MQILILIGSALIFPSYAFLLQFLKSALTGIIQYTTYLSIQVLIGFALTRYYQDLGARAKSKLILLDPVKLGAKWNSSHQELHTGEISRFFDDISVQLKKYDPSMDDVMDLTWFVVIVWAVISTGIMAVFNPHELFYASPSLVLAGLCVVNLYNGYRVSGLKSFDEIVEHLKYIVLSRISLMHAAAGKRHFQPGVCWLIKGKKKVLDDITIQILSKSREEIGTLCYWLGLPSNDDERLVIEILHEDQIPAIHAVLSDHPIVTNLGWKIETYPNGDVSRIVLRNERDVMRIDVQSTIILSPSKVADTSQNLANALEVIILALEHE
jgi:hypothetical protein